MTLGGKVALVTGGGAGIGAATCRLLAERGAAVLAADLNEAAATGTARAIRDAGGRAAAFCMDVADAAQTAAAVKEAEQQFGPLDIAVCNAGITDRIPALEMTREAFERILRTNLTGCFLSAQAAARAMVAHGMGGRIVTLASVSGQFGGTGRAAYGASKGGIINLTRVLAMEWAEHDILVNCVAPGPTQIARTAHGPRQRNAFLSRMALKRYADAVDIARGIGFLCSEDAGFVTGHVLNVDGGFAAAGVLYDPAEGA
jgi:3-oxoacyl-[acyl-carrier protein] reductase